MVELEGVASVADVARVQALRRGGETALVFEGRAMTFAEVDAMASRIANALDRVRRPDAGADRVSRQEQ